MPTATLRQNDPRQIFGWCMYDWANSAYALTVLAGLLPVYFAEAIVGEAGVVWWGWHFRAGSLWAAALTVAAALALVTAPVLGAIADYSAAKKRFLLFFAACGSALTLCLWFARGDAVLLTLGLFIGAQFSFVSANVFYNAFLPQIATEDKVDRVSGYGFALGYTGGALQFAAALLILLFYENLGISRGTAVRIGLASTGVWWGAFTLVTALLVPESPSLRGKPEAVRRRWAWAYARVGFRQVWRTTRRVGRYRHLVLFLLAYMLYNDGIQTVLTMASVYGKDELNLRARDLMITLLMVQLFAMGGALLFGYVAERAGTKRTLLGMLVVWCAVVAYAYTITVLWQFVALGVAVGVVMGGSQALSRSMYSNMIPPESSAEFFGFFTVFNKFSAIWGPAAFFLVAQGTGSLRSAILALIVFFVGGLVLLALVDVKQARAARDEALKVPDQPADQPPAR